MDWTKFIETVNKPLFSLGDTPVSVVTILQVLLVLAVVWFAARLTRTALRERVLTRVVHDQGARDAVARLTGHAVLLIGLLIGLSAVGFDLTSLTVLLGALGVGIGFGLQNIVSNFVSGLIILFERPIQIGQRIDVAGATGKVVRIGARSTTILTNDNIALILPNSTFIQEPVVNWSLGGDRRVRFKLPVGVGYGSDLRAVERILLQVARDNPNVLEDPAPSVVLKGFGDSAVEFELRVWTSTLSDRPSAFRSALYFGIWESFRKNRIEIPFPQRDVHIRSGAPESDASS